MKTLKLFSILLTTILILSSCQTGTGLSPTIQNHDYTELTDGLANMQLEGLQFAGKSAQQFLEKHKGNNLVFNQAQMVNSIIENWNGNYFQVKDSKPFAEGFSKVNLKKFSFNIQKSNSVNLFEEGGYTVDQAELAQPYVDALLEVDNIEDAIPLANDFQIQVENSSLSEEDKVRLFQMSSGTIALANYLLDDGIDDMYNIIEAFLEEHGGQKGCSVDMRSVWAGAVIGGAAGAVSGCYSGATAGTVAFPIVGTVTGCVSAGVIGGTGGFISGALMGLASELLTSCFRQ